MDTIIFEKRRHNLKKALAERKLPALLVSHAANRYYLSGFELHDGQCNESSGWVVVTADGPDYLFTDPRFTDAAKRLWPEQDTLIYTSKKHQEVGEFLKGKGVTAMGFDPTVTSLYDHEGLAPYVELTPVRDVVEGLRMYKDEEEIKRMQASVDLNHKIMRDIEQHLVPGATEKEIAWRIEKMFKDNGAEEMAFSSIVGVGRNAALCHAIPGEDVIRDGDLVLIDTGCRLNDYNSDQTRTFWVGDKPSDRFREVLEWVQGAQQAAIDMMRPGVSLHDGWKAAWDYFDKRGVAQYFNHGLGHGVGLETHEPPRMSRVAKGVMEPGMIITVEPGLYWDDWGGIRWEHEVLITEDGCRVL
ncbi:M24 family metallopeptidase [Pseudodesulfovibrio senegalensis]|uniref:Aminopeptidase P family protein n=1 Tax=Pseudodesulfovibrio senegalensis TaxID=1721087 RepID=A0A6N6N2Z2_9BACT|nr:Xaa-Pro peptidase family protein [Pseudodesulfovibrio senegalensis]KAB1441812.1 aminopeptidase P family protein [Pseudodesulfovibrio senegalensis]